MTFEIKIEITSLQNKFLSDSLNFRTWNDYFQIQKITIFWKTIFK